MNDMAPNVNKKPSTNCDSNDDDDNHDCQSAITITKT